MPWSLPAIYEQRESYHARAASPSQKLFFSHLLVLHAVSLVVHDGFNRLQACGRSAAANSPACTISFMMSSPPSSSPPEYS